MYEVIDLTEMFGERFLANDINDQGVVGANIRLNDHQNQACVVENGQLRMLPKYMGHPWGLSDLADNGDALGHDPLGTDSQHSIFYRNGKVFDMNLPAGPQFPAARGLNNLAQVTGRVFGRPFIWEDGNIDYLGSPEDRGGGSSINDSGVVAGAINVDDGGPTLHAARWIEGKLYDINPSWSDFSESGEINELGEIAGMAFVTGGGQRPVLWRDGKAIDLGDFGNVGKAYDVNDRSQVVGWSNDSQGILHGFLWEKGNLYKLADLVAGGTDYRITLGVAVNDAGQVLAGGGLRGEARWLVLNPVPEPSALISLALAICALTISRRSRRRRSQ